MKKYEFTGETMKEFGVTFRRIRALREVKQGNNVIAIKGETGGWIAEEKNLAQAGNAWVYGDARVYGNAWVYGDAQVYGDARVSGNARVYGNAWVYGDARVYGDAWVYGDARVYGNARVYGDAQVYGDARVSGNARVYGDARVYDNALIIKPTDILTVGPIGSRDATTTFFRDKSGGISVVCGCFLGTLAEFAEKVTATHGDSKHAKAYRAAVELVKIQMDVKEVDAK